MKYSRVYLEAMGYELPPVVMTSESLEARLAPLYEKLHFQVGQLEALTGIRERRWWEEGHVNAEGAVAAGRKALAASRVAPDDLGVLVYAGVCRDHLEPATACAVASGLGLAPDSEVYDISNACLGVLNGIVAIANRIELGQIRAGMVVSCETAREINEVMIGRMLDDPSMDIFTRSLATLTGGSGAVAVVITDDSFGSGRPRLAGGAMRSAPEHHGICLWDVDTADGNGSLQSFESDSSAVLKHGTVLGVETWRSFLGELGWSAESFDRVICHQVGTSHRDSILGAFGLPAAKDFSTFSHLGNMGTVSLPLTAELARERGFLQSGDRVGFLGIGSGLNCLMLGWEW